jgi:hypothetical protein
LHGHFELELGAHFKLEWGGQYSWNLHIDLSNLQSGLYFITVKVSHESIFRKIIKE